jgi:hypothetical protein
MNRRIVLVVALVILVMGVAEAQSGGLDGIRGQSYIESIDMLFTVRSGGQLSLGTSLGSVSVQTWSREQVRLVVTKRTSAADPGAARKILDLFSVRALHGGKDLRLEGLAVTDAAAKAMGVEFTLWVPKSYNLAIETKSGDVLLPEVEGTFTARTDDGRIILDCDTRKLDIEVEDRSGEPEDAEETEGRAAVGSRVGDSQDGARRR